MARDPGKDILKHPTPAAGTAKRTVDAVLSALKIGNGMVSLLSGLLAAVMILYSGYVLYDNFSTEYRAYSSAWDLLKYKPAVMNSGEPGKGAEILTAINKDYRAWLTVYDTTIDYPVVQGANDLYYATHDIYRNVSLTGAIYLAAGNSRDFSDSYNLLYGHHMDNGAMFGSLDRYRDSDYFYGHQQGIIITESGDYDVTLFAVAGTDAYESRIYSAGNRAEDVIAFLTGDRDGDAGIGTSVLIYDEKAAQGTKRIIALSTCADVNTNGRLVVFGRMTKRKTGKPGDDSGDEDPGGNDEPGGDAAEPEGKQAILTVRYLLDGREAFPDAVIPYTPGAGYYVVSPQYPGYDASIGIVRGTIETDTTVTVYYTARANRMTIRYAYMDGTEAADSYKVYIRTGEAFDVESPVIRGYRALRPRISGTNSGMNEEYTVLYIPEGEHVTAMMEDYGTMAGPGEAGVQAGLCAE